MVKRVVDKKVAEIPVEVAEVTIPEVKEVKEVEEVKEVVVPEVKAPEEKKETVVSVTLPEIPEASPVLEKNVKIRTSRQHRCVIGNTLYVFNPDKVYTVPETVKDILRRAGLLDVI